MGEESPRISQIQTWIKRWRAGDRMARDELFQHEYERLRCLTRRMFKAYPRVKRWEDTDDVHQEALLRLWNALADITPTSVRHFYALATLQIRRQLVDLSRKYFGPQGMGAKHASNGAGEEPASRPRVDKADSTLEPSRLAEWTEIHERVGDLPQQEREVFELHYYQGLTQADAAELLGISVATVKRRWLAARRRLHQALKGALPGT